MFTAVIPLVIPSEIPLGAIRDKTVTSKISFYRYLGAVNLELLLVRPQCPNCCEQRPLWTRTLIMVTLMHILSGPISTAFYRGVRCSRARFSMSA